MNSYYPVAADTAFIAEAAAPMQLHLFCLTPRAAYQAATLVTRDLGSNWSDCIDYSILRQLNVMSVQRIAEVQVSNPAETYSQQKTRRDTVHT